MVIGHDRNYPQSILLVDDDDVDREVFIRALDRMGMFSTIAEANSLSAARQQLRKHQFDCVLLDYHLGGELGTDLIPDVHAHREEPCPVILVTLRDAEEVLADSMRRGVSDYVAKSSVSPDRLREVITSAIRRPNWNMPRGWPMNGCVWRPRRCGTNMSVRCNARWTRRNRPIVPKACLWPI
jgi:DNA-binding NarL/FixJ family response regulator